jgi:hypothetical protein
VDVREQWSVVFYSPGTFVAETTARDIEGPHPRAAAAMAAGITDLNPQEEHQP